MRKSLLRAAGVVVAGLMATMLQSTPAHAHYDYLYQGRDVLSVSDDHRTGTVCDREQDGHYVYAWFYGAGSRYGEKDGGDPGCDEIFVYPQSFNAVKFCEAIPGRKDPCVWDHNL